jgi:hypothetical protein
MARFQCPNCQCEITLGDARVKRLAAAMTWACLGGLLVVLAAGFSLPHVGPAPLDPAWVEDVRSSHPDKPADADEIIRRRVADDEKAWQAHMPSLDREIVELGKMIRAMGIVLLLVGIPSAVLAISIRPEPAQSRPPSRPA